MINFFTVTIVCFSSLVDILAVSHVLSLKVKCYLPSNSGDVSELQYQCLNRECSLLYLGIETLLWFQLFFFLRNEHVVLGGVVAQNCFTVSVMCYIDVLRKHKWRRKRYFKDPFWRKHRMSGFTLSGFYFNVNCSVGKEQLPQQRLDLKICQLKVILCP